MGIKSKRKGYRLEHNLEKLLQTVGFKAKRVPLSGSVEGFAGDLIVEGSIKIKGIAEVKGRAKGFKQIYSWLNGKDVLFVKADRKPWLLILKIGGVKEKNGKVCDAERKERNRDN